MKKITRNLLLAVASFMLMMVMVPAMKAEAATAPAPKNINIWNQKGNELSISWDFDSSLKNRVKGKTFGYDILLQNVNGKTIKRLTEKSVRFTTDLSTCVVTASNGKFAYAPVKVKIRTYVGYGASRTYSKYMTKYIVPRAKISGGSVVNNSKNAVRITWNKVTGASSYSLYLSYNTGKTFKKVATTTGTAATTGALQMYKTYIVYVQANNVKCGSYRYNSSYIKYTNNRAANTWAFRIRYR